MEAVAQYEAWAPPNPSTQLYRYSPLLRVHCRLITNILVQPNQDGISPSVQGHLDATAAGPVLVEGVLSRHFSFNNPPAVLVVGVRFRPGPSFAHYI